MRPSELLNQHREAIRQVVAAHRANNPRVFGSVVHGEDTEASDLDLLIDPGEGMSLFDMGAIIAELNELLGIEVDVVSARAMPEPMRQRVLRDALPI
jgi:predicted nucleotidyltransferase